MSSSAWFLRVPFISEEGRPDDARAKAAEKNDIRLVNFNHGDSVAFKISITARLTLWKHFAFVKAATEMVLCHQR